MISRWERQADVKSEYYDGEIVMTAGGRPPYRRIAANMIRHLGNALVGSSCGAYTSDLKVRSSPTQFVYPDVAVICGELEFHDVRQDVVTIPIPLRQIYQGVVFPASDDLLE